MRLLRLGLALVLVVTAAACARTVLPREADQKRSAFSTYENAEQAFNFIEPWHTSQAELDALGLNPRTAPNISVLNYLDVRRYFLKETGAAVTELDPAVQACIKAEESCTGYQIIAESLNKQREGSVALDVLGFRRETIKTGWEAEMLLLMVDGVVVYKLWSGTPNVAQRETQTRPLGPLQDLSGAAAGAVRSAIPN